MIRLVQISDTHISRWRGVLASNFERMAAFIAEQLNPDLIVHTGDVIAASPDADDDRLAAASLLGVLAAPVRIIPGNHDVGEPGPRPWMGVRVTSARVAAHQAAFGPDRFVELSEGWAIVGLNSELLGSALPDEEEQWEWLERTLRSALARDVLLFLHKPIWLPSDRPAAAALSVPPSARDRLLALPGADRLRAVGSGHLHHYRRRDGRSPMEVWAPATGFIAQSGVQPEDLNQLGVVEWRLEEGRAQAWFRAPVGLDELEATAIPEMMASVAELETAAA